jgi:cytochrome c oxidase assembly protein subunit 11
MIRLPANKNVRVAGIAALGAVVMIGAAYAAVPLYDLFCRVTGYGGTTQVAVGEAGAILDREVTVYFDANTNRNLPWTFEPVQRSMTVRIGESALAYYTATNNSDQPVTGVATYNVAPYKVATYFSKLECFCFTQQTLQPGESIEMPVLFFVDPLLDDEPHLDDVTAITLSYTFFESQDGGSANTDAAP